MLNHPRALTIIHEAQLVILQRAWSRRQRTAAHCEPTSTTICTHLPTRATLCARCGRHDAYPVNIANTTDEIGTTFAPPTSTATARRTNTTGEAVLGTAAPRPAYLTASRPSWTFFNNKEEAISHNNRKTNDRFGNEKYRYVQPPWFRPLQRERYCIEDVTTPTWSYAPARTSAAMLTFID